MYIIDHTILYKTASNNFLGVSKEEKGTKVRHAGTPVRPF